MSHYAEPPEIPGVTGLQMIGRGGFGTVYRGEQTGLGRHVAVKVLRVEKPDRKTLRAFEREAKLMTKLSKHPNVPDVHLTGVLHDQRPYLVYQFCAKGALRGDRPLPAPRVVEIGAKMAAVLELAHSHGIVHRDVKPGNILIDDNDEPLLGDFGLSLQPSHDASPSLDAFAPPYAAPEVLEASSVQADATADIYSLGATLFALLTGGPPFPRRSGEPEMAWIMRVKTAPMPALAPTVPEPFQDLLRRLLAKAPHDRPTAQQAAQQLRGLLRDWHAYQRQVRAAPAPPAEQTTMRADFAAPATTPVVPTMDRDIDGTRMRAAATPGGSATPPREHVQRQAAPTVPAAVQRRIRRPVLIVGGITAVVLVAGVIVANLLPGGQKPGAPVAQNSLRATATAATSTASASAVPGAATIVLAEAKDGGSYVELSWTGPPGLQYVVVVGEAGKPEAYRIVNRSTTARIDVSPSTPLCFRVQGADASGPKGESNVVGIRGARCRFD